MSDYAMITALRDVMQIREDVLADSQRQQPIFTLEQRSAIVHLANTYLDELLGPWTHGSAKE